MVARPRTDFDEEKKRVPIAIDEAAMQLDPAQTSSEYGRHRGAVRYQSALCHVQKKTVLYNPYNIPNGCGEGIGILDFAALAIENQISFLGDELRASV